MGRARSWGWKTAGGLPQAGHAGTSALLRWKQSRQSSPAVSPSAILAFPTVAAHNRSGRIARAARGNKRASLVGGLAGGDGADGGERAAEPPGDTRGILGETQPVIVIGVPGARRSTPPDAMVLT